MGGSVSKKQRKPFGEEKDPNEGLLLAEKVRLLQKEIREIVCSREKETRAYERDIMVFSCKEVEWKKERKKLREEVKRLKVMLEEKEEAMREMEVSSLLVEHMEEEKIRRDETVDKWKKLYLAIKTELDDLIERTYQGDTLHLRSEEDDLMDELQKVLKAKEDTIEILQAQLTSAKLETTKKDRELDILRQSLRITSNKKMTRKPWNWKALMTKTHKREMKQEQTSNLIYTHGF